jgi:glycerol-3-phosphate acyltransferase PlsY
MTIWIMLLAALAGYLSGSISFARIIGRIVAPGENIERTALEMKGSGTTFELKAVSATSLAVRKGPKAGCATSILDMLKAAIPALAFRLLFPQDYYHLIAAAAAVIGHNFPIYHRFKGGRGMSAVMGGLFVVDWLAIPVGIAASALIGLAILRDVFFAYAGWVLLIIPWLWFRFGDPAYIIYAVVVNAVYWIAVIPELKEYLEHKRRGDFAGQKLLGGREGQDGGILQSLAHVFIGQSKQQPPSPEQDEPSETG